MITAIYTLATHVAYFFVVILSVFNKKTRLWITGRWGWRNTLREWRKLHGNKVIWFHAASLGEFEQGRPVMQQIKERFPGYAIVLTFYSPSGYEIRKEFPGADLVSYLPLDTFYNAGTFIQIIRPEFAIFIKYEFWYFYLQKLAKNKIPVYLISAIFRKDQVFFKWYGWWFRKNLRVFSRMFVQDILSETLLAKAHFQHITLSGDTRFDRVAAIAAAKSEISYASAFTMNKNCMVAGSTWPADEELLSGFFNNEISSLRLIIAPHEIGEKRIKYLEKLFALPSVRYSQLSTNTDSDQYRILIIDNIGMLSSLYKYGIIAYIGGGFGKGIHNILEPAAAGLPGLLAGASGYFFDQGSGRRIIYPAKIALTC